MLRRRLKSRASKRGHDDQINWLTGEEFKKTKQKKQKNKKQQKKTYQAERKVGWCWVVGRITWCRGGLLKISVVVVVVVMVVVVVGGKEEGRGRGKIYSRNLNSL